MLTAKQPAGIDSHSLSKNPHIPSFHIQGGERATQKKFGRVWQPVSALKMPTFLKRSLSCFKGMSKRGGLVPRQLPRVKRVQVRQAAEEEEEAARHDSDMSVDSYPLE